MGIFACIFCKPSDDYFIQDHQLAAMDRNHIPIGKNKPLKRKVKWSSKSVMTIQQLMSKREVFWDTQPKYGGIQEIWIALKAACEAEDDQFAQSIVDSINLTIPTGILSDGAFDELGNRYVVPLYCFSIPTNIVGSLSAESIDTHGGSSHDIEESPEDEDDASQVTLNLRLSTGEDIQVSCRKNDKLDFVKGEVLRKSANVKESSTLKFMYLGKVVPDSSKVSHIMKISTQSDYIIQVMVIDI